MGGTIFLCLRGIGTGQEYNVNMASVRYFQKQWNGTRLYFSEEHHLLVKEPIWEIQAMLHEGAVDQICLSRCETEQLDDAEYWVIYGPTRTDA